MPQIHAVALSSQSAKVLEERGDVRDGEAMGQPLPHQEEKLLARGAGAGLLSSTMGSLATTTGDEESSDEERAALAAMRGRAGSGSGDERGGDSGAEGGKSPKDKNWSAVQVAFKEGKLAFRGNLTPVAFTNWLWYRCIRPKLEDTKGKLPPIDTSVFGIDDIEDIMGEFVPVPLKKKEDKKDDKEDKKDKKDDKKKDTKKKKDQVVLNAKEKVQVQNLIRNMVYGELGKGKTLGFKGWVNMLDEKEVPYLIPWEFQIAYVLRGCMLLEHAAKKSKKNPEPAAYYELVQSLADAISIIREQYRLELPDAPQEALLPLQDVLHVQERFREGSVGTLKFDPSSPTAAQHLAAGSSFMKRHKGLNTKIQEPAADAASPGPASPAPAPRTA